MKTRSTFVSNSSSSSFLIQMHKKHLVNKDALYKHLGGTRKFNLFDKPYTSRQISDALYTLFNKKNPATKSEIIEFFKWKLELLRHRDYDLLSDESYISCLRMLNYKTKYNVDAQLNLLMKYIFEFKYIQAQTRELYEINTNYYINTERSPIPKLIDELSYNLYLNAIENKRQYYVIDVGCGGGKDMDNDIGGIIRIEYEDIFKMCNYIQIDNS